MKVVGGGIIGLSIAWRLAQRGVAVEVYDAGRIAFEASWAGAGMLAPGGEVDRPTRLAKLAVESLKLYPQFVQELEAESGISIDYQACGAIEHTETDARAIAQAALGIRTERWNTRQIFYPEDAAVNPRDVTKALCIACEKRRVGLHEFSPVTRIDGPAVLAAGAWSSSIETPVAMEPSFPVRGHLVAYQMEPGSLPHMHRSGHTYILQRRSGLTIAGSETERVGYDRNINRAVVEDIDRRARQILPQLPAMSDAWLGFRPATQSLEPEIGLIPGSHIFRAYGHYRNGILLAPLTAQMAVEQLA